MGGGAASASKTGLAPAAKRSRSAPSDDPAGERVTGRPPGQPGHRKVRFRGGQDQVAEPAAAQHCRVRDQARVRENRPHGRDPAPGVGEGRTVAQVRGEDPGWPECGGRRRRELDRGHMSRSAGPGEQVGDHQVKRPGPDLLQDRAGVADPDPDPGRTGPPGRCPPSPGPPRRCPAPRLVQGQQPPDQIDQGRVAVHGQLPGSGTGRRHVPGQGESPAAEVQDPQRLPGGCGQVGQVPEPPHVLELQVLRVVQVYVGLRDAIHPQGPGPRPVSVGHELGHARRDICLDGLPGSGLLPVGHIPSIAPLDRKPCWPARRQPGKTLGDSARIVGSVACLMPPPSYGERS